MSIGRGYGIASEGRPVRSFPIKLYCLGLGGEIVSVVIRCFLHKGANSALSDFLSSFVRLSEHAAVGTVQYTELISEYLSSDCVSYGFIFLCTLG
jgi:hypothetical protein